MLRFVADYKGGFTKSEGEPHSSGQVGARFA